MIEKLYGHSSTERAPGEDDLKIRVQVYKDLEELSFAAASLFVKFAIDESNAKGLFTVLLSGGSTPERLYELLTEGEIQGADSLGPDPSFLGRRKVCKPDSS